VWTRERGALGPVGTTGEVLSVGRGGQTLGYPTKHVRTHTHKLTPLNHFTVVPQPLSPLRFNTAVVGRARCCGFRIRRLVRGCRRRHPPVDGIKRAGRSQPPRYIVFRRLIGHCRQLPEVSRLPWRRCGFHVPDGGAPLLAIPSAVHQILAHGGGRVAAADGPGEGAPG